MASTLTQPGPSSIEHMTGGAATSPQESMWARRDWLVKKHGAHKERVKEVTNIANGNWHTVWPDLSRTPEAPSVANVIEMGIAHWQSIGGATLPSVRVPVVATSEQSTSRRRARKRERRLRELWASSNTSELSALLWGDYAGTGSAVMGVWANFDEPDPAKRNPHFIRFDPRHTYVLKDNIGNITELLVARVISKAEVAAMFPESFGLFSESHDQDVEEWFWYTSSGFKHMIVDVSENGRKNQTGMIFADEPNELGFVPAWEIVRPTFDGQRRGIFDQTLHLLRVMHRLMQMTIYSTEEQVFPPMLEYNTLNADEMGPGAIISARGPDSKFERIGPTSHFDVKDLIARLADEARQGAVYPQQLSGEPGASIVSARGISASMGGLDARLALAHKQFETLFGKTSGFLLAMDEIYCDGDKEIKGDWRDNRNAEKFRPSDDIQGMWEAFCTYGIGSGSDPANTEVRVSMNLASGLISKQTGREQLPFLDDPDKEEMLITKELTHQALLTGVFQAASQGDPVLAAELLKRLSTEDAELDDAVASLVDFITAPQESPGGGQGALGAIQGAESLARGGIPGSAEQAPPSGGLPPLGQILGQDSRQIS